MSGKDVTFGIVIPVMNEEECIGIVLDELNDALGGDERFRIAVGLNGSSDRSGEIAREKGALVSEVDERGYGHGCMAAIKALEDDGAPDAYIFYSGDGGNSPEDLLKLANAFEQGKGDFVIGQRTCRPANWKRLGADRALPNITLGLWLTLLTFKPWLDLGPLRLISADLFRRMGQQELTWGWTAEGQILASRLGASIHRITVDERPRIAGQQKVSRVSFRRSLSIGLQIVAAAWKVRWRRLNEVTQESNTGCQTAQLDKLEEPL